MPFRYSIRPRRSAGGRWPDHSACPHSARLEGQAWLADAHSRTGSEAVPVLSDQWLSAVRKFKSRSIRIAGPAATSNSVLADASQWPRILDPIVDMISILPSARQEIDLDKRVARERGNTNAGARGQAPGREIGLIDRVHRRVVALEMCQINPRKHDLVEAAADAGQDQLQVLDNSPRLRLDAVRQHRAVVIRIGRHLAGDEEPAIR